MHVDFQIALRIAPRARRVFARVHARTQTPSTTTKTAKTA